MSEEAEQPDWDSLFADVPNLKQRAFFAAFCQCGRIKTALRAAKTWDKAHWYWLVNDPDYASRFEKVRRIAGAMLEERAMVRAMQGLVRKKFHKGEPIKDQSTGKQYQECEFYEPLTMFLLKGFFPDKYRERTEQEIKGEMKVDVSQPPSWLIARGRPNP